MQHALGIPKLSEKVMENWRNISALRRDFDHSETYADRFSLRTTLLWNGAVDVSGNFEGNRVYDNAVGHKKRVSAIWQSASSTPSFLVVNDGLHSGHWAQGTVGLREFFRRARDDAVPFWISNPSGSKQMPVVIFRSTVSPANHARWALANPQNVLLINKVYAALLNELKPLTMPAQPVVDSDSFDITAAWHWDDLTNDGGHYGRTPEFYEVLGYNASARKYFVDDMVGQALLAAMCSK